MCGIIERNFFYFCNYDMYIVFRNKEQKINESNIEVLKRKVNIFSVLYFLLFI